MKKFLHLMYKSFFSGKENIVIKTYWLHKSETNNNNTDIIKGTLQFNRQSVVQE